MHLLSYTHSICSEPFLKLSVHSTKKALNLPSPHTNTPLPACEVTSSLPLKIKTLSALPSLPFHPLFHMFSPPPLWHSGSPGTPAPLLLPVPHFYPVLLHWIFLWSQVHLSRWYSHPPPHSLFLPPFSIWLQRRIIHSRPLYFVFLSFFIFLFLGLHWVSVAAHGISVEACGIFRCGTRASLVEVHWLLSRCGKRALEHAGSVVVAHGLCCPRHVGS